MQVCKDRLAEVTCLLIQRHNYLFSDDYWPCNKQLLVFLSLKKSNCKGKNDFKGIPLHGNFQLYGVLCRVFCVVSVLAFDPFKILLVYVSSQWEESL